MSEAAAEALRGGGIILVPTDTVWGMAVRGDDAAAVAALYALKGRPPDKPLVRLIADWNPQDADLSSLPPRTERVARALWPGPLTIVCPTGQSLRWPDHRPLCQLLRGTRFPVLVTSANRSGAPEARQREDLDAVLCRAVAAISDGESGGGRPSTVVRFDADGPEILRPGPVSLGRLCELWYPRLAFVCTGNTCRSPMAEALARRELVGSRITVVSAGVAAAIGEPASPQAVQVCAEHGLDLQNYRSRSLEEILRAGVDRIYAMTGGHVRYLRELGVTAELLDPEGRDVPDPYGAAPEIYRQCLSVIARAIAARRGDWQRL